LGIGIGGVPNCLSPVEDGPVATELKFKSRENNPLRGILNPAPPDRERSLPLMATVGRSCPAQTGVETKMAVMINPTIKKVLFVTIDKIFIELILRY
jgi:hypothetical protein